LLPSFSFPDSRPHRHLHSFPTRRSSDLFSNPGRRVTAAYVYKLPEMRRAGPVARGWQLSGTVMLQDGMPENPFYFTLDFANSGRSEEHTSELQSPYDLVCRLLLEKKKVT